MIHLKSFKFILPGFCQASCIYFIKFWKFSSNLGDSGQSLYQISFRSASFSGPQWHVCWASGLSIDCGGLTLTRLSTLLHYRVDYSAFSFSDVLSSVTNLNISHCFFISRSQFGSFEFLPFHSSSFLCFSLLKHCPCGLIPSLSFTLNYF